jgi:hypothetical protein
MGHLNEVRRGGLEREQRYEDMLPTKWRVAFQEDSGDVGER